MEGYAKVAQLMASQDEHAILRRFRVLNMQNLLYLQAEITHLESDLAELANRDTRHQDRGFFTKDWWSLSQGDEEEEVEQWDKFQELRNKLEIYNEALVKQAYLARLEPPRKYDLEFLRRWLERPGMGAFPLLGPDGRSWEPRLEDDLVAIRARAAPDAFSRWFAETLTPMFHHRLGKRFKDPLAADKSGVGVGVYSYAESSLQASARVAATVVASLIPLCSVITLYMVASDGARLGLIVLFSACFSLALALMTGARTVEIFAATAAFAAVNVVFLGNGNNNNNNSVCVVGDAAATS